MVSRKDREHRQAMERMFDALNMPPEKPTFRTARDAFADLFYELPPDEPAHIPPDSRESNYRENMQTLASEYVMETVPGDVIWLHGEGALPVKATTSQVDQVLIANDATLKRLLSGGDMRGVGRKVKRRLGKMQIADNVIDWDAYHDAHPDRYGPK